MPQGSKFILHCSPEVDELILTFIQKMAKRNKARGRVGVTYVVCGNYWFCHDELLIEYERVQFIRDTRVKSGDLYVMSRQEYDTMKWNQQPLLVRIARRLLGWD